MLVGLIMHYRIVYENCIKLLKLCQSIYYIYAIKSIIYRVVHLQVYSPPIFWFNKEFQIMSFAILIQFLAIGRGGSKVKKLRVRPFQEATY